MNPYLCLGTAQFGMNYGVTNKNTRLDLKDICSILKYANYKSIKYLDTAQSYGNAEELIGCSDFSKKFKIISKFSIPKGNYKLSELKKILEANLKESLSDLKVESLDALLFHDPNDLRTGFGIDILNWLKDLKNIGTLKRIGVSIYSEEDLVNLPIDSIDIIQLPISIYDQRFLKKNIIGWLKNKNISVHVRSIFLQGIILADNNNFPNFLSNEFREHHQCFLKNLKNHETDALSESLKFIKSIGDIEAILIGISKFEDLIEITSKWEKIRSVKYKQNFNFKKFEWNSPDELDPRKWKTSI